MSTPIKEAGADAEARVPAQGVAAARRGAADGARGGGDGVLNVFSHGFLALWAVMIVLPLVWIVLGSFKTDAQIGGSAWTWPAHWGIDAFTRAWEKGSAASSSTP